MFTKLRKKWVLDWVIDQHNIQTSYSKVSIDLEESASHPLPLPEGVSQVFDDLSNGSY